LGVGRRRLDVALGDAVVLVGGNVAELSPVSVAAVVRDELTPSCSVA
jgi:hypothetical protein